jgi:hypothetical protein
MVMVMPRGRRRRRRRQTLATVVYKKANGVVQTSARIKRSSRRERGDGGKTPRSPFCEKEESFHIKSVARVFFSDARVWFVWFCRFVSAHA